MTEYEGTWEEIAMHASEFRGQRVRLTVLSPSQPAPLSFQDRRAFLKLPLAERRRLLAQQAEQMVAHYEEDSEWREFLEGDLVDY